MKVLFVSHSAVLEEHQQKLQILAEKYGHEIWLCMPPHWYEGGKVTKAYTGNSKIHYEIGKVFFWKKVVHLYLNAGEIVKRINPDIIHIEEEPFDFPCFQFIRAAKARGKKALFFTWENLKRGHNLLYTYFNNNSILNADAAIAGNTEAKDILIGKNFKNPVEIIPQYGVNMEDFKVKKNKDDSVSFNVSYI